MIDDDRPGSHEREDEFWGSTPDWTNDVERPRRKRRSDSSGDITGAIKNLWGSAVSGGASATRSHGVFDANAPRPADEYDGGTAAGTERAEVNDLYLEIDRAETTEVPVVDARGHQPPAAEMSVEPATLSRRIDPLLARVGAVAIVTTLLVPLLIGLRSGDSADTLSSANVPAPARTSAESTLPEASAASTSSTPAESVYLDPSELPPAIPANSSAPVEAPSSVDSSATTTTAEAEVSTTQKASDTAVAISDSIEVKASDIETTEVTVAQVAADPVCAVDYIVQSGDYWIGIADGAGVPLAELLTANGANVSTPLYPGADICLPAGATTPTTAAPTTAAPSTAAPTTTAATPPPSPVGAEEVEQIIRDVWPDELEDRALVIAYRESRYSPTAKNYCCYGLFQIYWEVHDSWLGGIGVTSAQQLYDPATNARAAYALYQRSGGWGPWSQTDY